MLEDNEKGISLEMIYELSVKELAKIRKVKSRCWPDCILIWSLGTLLRSFGLLAEFSS